MLSPDTSHLFAGKSLPIETPGTLLSDPFNQTGSNVRVL